jgi:hypothetical protein
VAAGCVLAATVVSGCDDNAGVFAKLVCQQSDGEVYGGQYPGIQCRHSGDDPARRLDRRGAAPAADRFRASTQTRVVHRPKIRRRGQTARANGMRLRGTLRVRPTRRAKRTLRGFTRGRFATVGGSGRAARLRIIGQAPYDSSARTVSGTLASKRSRPRRAPRACRPLLARVKRRA